MEKTQIVGSSTNIYQKITIENSNQSNNYSAMDEAHIEPMQYVNQISQVLKNKEIAEKGYLKSLLAVVFSMEALKNMSLSDALNEILNIMNLYNTKVYWTEPGSVLFGASLNYSNGESARADRESLVEIVNEIIHDKKKFQITIRENDNHIYCINPYVFIKIWYPIGDNVEQGKLIFQKPVSQEIELDKFAIQLIDSDYIPEDSFDKVQIVSILKEDKTVSCINIINTLEQELESIKDFPKNKQEVEYKILFCLREIFKLHPFQDANGRIIGGFLFYIISMKYNLSLISVVTPSPLLGMFTIEKLVESYRVEQENFVAHFETHENYLNYLLSLYLETCHNRPKIQADQFAKLILKYGWCNKLLQESDKLAAIIDCLLAIEHNVTEIENNTLKNIMTSTVAKLSDVSLDYLGFFQKMVTDISKKDFNLLMRRCATNDIFEPILLFLLEDSNRNEFNIDLDVTSKDGRNPLQIAKDFKAEKIVNLIKSKMPK